MQKMEWLETHLGSMDDAQELINRFCWHLSVTEKHGKWYVATGNDEKHVLFTADSRDAVDAFLYGMALAYAGIPGHLLDNLASELKSWQESL